MPVSCIQVDWESQGSLPYLSAVGQQRDEVNANLEPLAGNQLIPLLWNIPRTGCEGGSTLHVDCRRREADEFVNGGWRASHGETKVELA